MDILQPLANKDCQLGDQQDHIYVSKEGLYVYIQVHLYGNSATPG